MTRCRCRKKREESFLVISIRFVFQFICEKINRQNDLLLLRTEMLMLCWMVFDNKEERARWKVQQWMK